MAYAIVSHWAEGSTNGNGFTSAAHDTSGGDEIVVALIDFDGTSTLSDSKSNTWVASYTPDTIRTPTTQIWNAKNALVGTGHTFTVGGSAGKSPAIFVLVLSGSDTSSGVDQAANHFIDFASSGQPGSITPTVDNEIVISVCDHQDFSSNLPTIDSGFTISDSLVGAGGQHWGGAAAYIIETTATAKNPTWTMSTSSLTSAGIASFKAAAGGGGGPTVTYPELERTLRGARRGILLGAR